MIRYRDKLDAMSALDDDMRKLYDEMYYEYANGPIMVDANDIMQDRCDISVYILDYITSKTDELD